MRGVVAALTATLALALALAGAARAEMPANRAAPEVTGRAAVGWGVVGHNGTWLYADGTACGAECLYEWQWERCRPSGCRAIAGALGRVYKVRRVDIGARLRVRVRMTKYDCGEWNYAEGTQECRWVTTGATSVETSAVPRPRIRPRR